MPLFCRHNRLLANCAICSRENEESLPGGAARPRKRAARSTDAAPRRPRGLRTQRLVRAADDGYRNPLVPGLRARADAQRLGAALTAAAERLTPPGPHPEVAAVDDPDAAVLAAVRAVGGDETAFVDWAARNGGTPAAAIAGDHSWSEARRFTRLFERLGFLPRAARFELLVTLGSARGAPLAPETLHLGADDDAATVAAKRILLSGDRVLLERRAKALALAAGVPLAALDHALATWETGGGDGDVAPAVARALALA